MVVIHFWDHNAHLPFLAIRTPLALNFCLLDANQVDGHHCQFGALATTALSGSLSSNHSERHQPAKHQKETECERSKVATVVGSGKYTYKVAEGWGKLPKGWQWGWIVALACDSQDRVFVYSRSEHPLVIFDREGNFLASWGKDILKDAHGIFIDADDNVYCVDRNTHCLRKFNRYGELVMTLGTPGQPAPKEGMPFNRPTDVAVAPTRELFVSDGYGNSRIHKFSPDGELIKSWGESGSGNGQFALPHCVRVDKYGRVWVCDRENNRIQIFDADGNFLEQWTGLLRPNTIYLDVQEDIVYVAELEHRVSIWTLDGELIAKFGCGKKSDKPCVFLGGPHGIWMDSHGDLYVGEVFVEGRFQKFIRQR
jgi:sugar lactone lactonase YvrE